jgi:DNA-binding NarL/FixJ family response regulator
VPIKVVLAEDSYLVREGVRRLLESGPDIDLVGVCEDYDSLLEAIAGAEPAIGASSVRTGPVAGGRRSGG